MKKMFLTLLISLSVSLFADCTDCDTHKCPAEKMGTCEKKIESQCEIAFSDLAYNIGQMFRHVQDDEHVKKSLSKIVANAIFMVSEARESGISISKADCNRIIDELDNDTRTELLKFISYKNEVVRTMNETTCDEECTDDADCKDCKKKDDLKKECCDEIKRSVDCDDCQDCDEETIDCKDCKKEVKKDVVAATRTCCREDEDCKKSDEVCDCGCEIRGCKCDKDCQDCCPKKDCCKKIECCDDQKRVMHCDGDSCSL